MANKPAQNAQSYNILRLNPQIQAAENTPGELAIIPFNGQWMPGSNPALIGHNYREMTNIRYGKDHPETVLGMTKQNSTALADSTARTLTYAPVASIDLTDQNQITFYIYSSRTGSNITIGLHDSGGVTSENTPNVAAVNTWQLVEWNISAIANADKNAIDRIIITIVDATVAGTYYIDSLKGSTGAGVTLDLMEYASDAAAQAAYVTSESLNLQCYTEATIKASDGSSTKSLKIVDNGSIQKVRKAFQFTKTLHAENHLLVQAFNTNKTVSRVFQNITSIPSTGNFASTVLWTDSAGSGLGTFCDSPNGQVVYCNGVDNCIWDGDETRVAAFIQLGATLTNAGDALTSPLDNTTIINNTRTDTPNLVNIGGGRDPYTVVLLHFDGANDATAITDSSAVGHEFTSRNGAKLSTALMKFGVSSADLDGTNDYWDTTYHADYDLGTADFTIDVQWKTDDINSDSYGICGFYKGANDYWYLTVAISREGGGDENSWGYIQFKAVVDSTVVANYQSGEIYLGGNEYGHLNYFRHLAVSRVGTTMHFFSDGAILSKIETVAIGANSLSLGSGTFEVGAAYNHTLLARGNIDEFRLSKGIGRYAASFPPPTGPYLSTVKSFLLGSTRPFEGAKIYVETPNTVAATMTGKVFTASSWTALTLDDDTIVDSKTLAQTGSVNWGDISSIAKQKYLNGYFLYWVLLEVDAGAAMVSHITLDVPFQEIKDVWDGNMHDLAAAYKTTSATSVDIVLSIRDYNNYLALDTASFVDISSLATTSCIEVGFTSRQTALFIAVPDGYINAQATTGIIISYWNGSEYVIISPVSDGTSEGSISLAKTGIVSWNNNNIDNEIKRSVSGSFPQYFYRISFDDTIDPNTRIYYIGGIPIPAAMGTYEFGVRAADRLMLGCDNSERKNILRISAQDRPEVFNGSDTQDIVFGGDEALTCAAPVYAQYSSNIYNIVLVYKAMETWILQWNQSSTGVSWSRFCISPNIGCPAPGTLCTASVTFENNINQAKSVGIWRAHDGIYLSNGQSPFCVSKDIRTVFDQTSATHINLAMAEYENSFIDKEKLEYHWLWASNDNTTLDKEYVLDLEKWRWFEIDRTSGKRIQCGVAVIDTNGGNYTYGFLDTGYMERLEYGTTFDGSDITSTLFWGEQLMVEKNLAYYTSIQNVNIICVAKNTDTALTLTHYLDGATSGTSYSLSMADADHAFASVMKDIYSNPAVFHGFKLVAVSNDETYGFEPLYMTATYQKVRVKTR